mgnify:CR=1 FL=1
MNSLAQFLTVTEMNVRNLPQRIGTSLVVVIGVAGVVAVLTAALTRVFTALRRGPRMACRRSALRTRFRPDGVCSLIPSLVGGESIVAGNVRVRAYPSREQDGLIWVYMSAPGRESDPPSSEPPKVRIPDARPRWSESQTFACAIDHAVIGLMDPAHAPYVHGRWWWRVTPRVKEKKYGPLPTGFVMLRHAPSKPAYKMLGDVSTEITFELPSTRFENITGTVQIGRAHV